MLIRLLFFEKLHFPQVDLRILFFPLFFRESSAGEFWSSNPNKLLHVRHFAASNQCIKPDLLKNMMVKLTSVYVHVRWLVGFNPRPLSVSLRLQSVYSSCWFWIKAIKNVSVNGTKREANTIEHKRQEKRTGTFCSETKSTFHYWIEIQFDYWIIHFMNGLLNWQNKSFFHSWIY